MNIKANGRPALILATGLFVCFAGPSQAAPNSANAATASNSDNDSDAGAPIALSKYTKHAVHHARNDTHRKSSKEAAKGSDTDKAPASDAADAGNNGGGATAIPPSVANANAQLTSADTPAGNAKAMTDRANNILQAAPENPPGTQPATDPQPAADPQVVSADQLNDVDRALHETAAPAPATMATARLDAPASAPAPAATASRESSTWDQASLIGKIFIGFGALLTMASAARMFIA